MSNKGCEAPVVPYEEEELSYLEDDDTEPVSAAELLARVGRDSVERNT